jgi:hypothetical protein
MQTVLGFWDFFWIGFVVMTCSGGTQYVLRNDDESEPLAPSLKSRPTLQARIKARLLEKRRPLVRTSKWKAVRRAGVALS